MRNKRKENLVIVADDDLLVRKLVLRGLDGFTAFREVTDGAVLMDIYKAEMPDVLFLDIHLPNVSGLDLVSQIMAVDPGAYIVMLSADSTQTNVLTAVKRGAKGFLTKPFKFDDLMFWFNKCETIHFM